MSKHLDIEPVGPKTIWEWKLFDSDNRFSEDPYPLRQARLAPSIGDRAALVWAVTFVLATKVAGRVRNAGEWVLEGHHKLALAATGVGLAATVLGGVGIARANMGGERGLQKIVAALANRPIPPFTK